MGMSLKEGELYRELPMGQFRCSYSAELISIELIFF